MKTLALTIITALTFQITIAQNHYSKNRVTVKTEKEDGITTVNWTSYQEVNTSYFLIERSDDGINFYTIGKEKAGSSTYTAKEYSFEDVDVDSQFHTYRVTLVMMDGEQISTIEQFSNYDNLVDTIGK